MLHRYRFWQELWNEDSTEVYVDSKTYAFRRGTKLVGAAKPAAAA